MKPENWITLGGGLLTAFCTVIGLYFGPKRAVRLALEQFREEKWWERKATAYDDIVRSAARLCSFHSNCLTTLSQGYRINEAWYAPVSYTHLFHMYYCHILCRSADSSQVCLPHFTASWVGGRLRAK